MLSILLYCPNISRKHYNKNHILHSGGNCYLKSCIQASATSNSPAEARIVHTRALRRDIILSASAISVLYESSLYRWAASINLRL